MIKLAIYGKGGIGKSTIASNISYVLSEEGLNVLQIGCDPKADSTYLLTGGKPPTPILSVFYDKGPAAKLSELVTRGYGGVYCAETGGRRPDGGVRGAESLPRWRNFGARRLFRHFILMPCFTMSLAM